MADINSVGKSFTDFYYNTFDTNRSNLSSLYRPESMLSFEGSPHQGAASIVEKLTSLPFQKVQHKVNTIDVQPSNLQSGSLLVAITGQLLIDDSPYPQLFNQTFQLIPDGGSYYVLNDIFRLNYG
ncbi:nuclear transport factor 2 [Syncephalis fuscata]|nr:nuclear transport factor 2 [Syncephalis fuscata]